MAGRYGPASVTVTLEDGPGGTARALTNFILEGISVKRLVSGGTRSTHFNLKLTALQIEEMEAFFNE